MEYLNLEKSGLITILIPLNFLIGEYTLFFRKRKIASTCSKSSDVR